MTRTLLLLAAGLALASCAMTPTPKTATTPELAKEFAPTGTLRMAVNYGNPVIVQKDPAGGPPRGVGGELARELARRLGVTLAYVDFDTAGKAADAVKLGAVDLVFLAVDPARAADIAFSAPYVQIEGTYMVPANSPLKAIGDFDRPGVRIAVGLKSAYDLFLTREIRQATLVRAPTSIAAVEKFRAEKLEAVAGVKNPLMAIAAKDPSMRVIEGNFMVIGQASGVPKARVNAAAYLKDFIEEMKASGFVAKALKDSGVSDATVAPAAR